MRRAAATVTVCVALLAGLTACAPQPDAATLAAARLAAARERIPAGYEDAKRGLAYRWDDRSCTAAKGSCRIVHLYAYDTCDNGWLEGSLLDAKGREVGVVNGSVDIAKAGGRDHMTVEWTKRSAVDVHLTDLECD